MRDLLALVPFSKTRQNEGLVAALRGIMRFLRLTAEGRDGERDFYAFDALAKYGAHEAPALPVQSRRGRLAASSDRARRSHPARRGTRSDAHRGGPGQDHDVCFRGTPLEIVLRDCGVRAYLIAGVATELGIEPTVRHSTDLGYIPVVVRDAGGAGDEAAGRRALESLPFAGEAIFTDTEGVCSLLAACG